MISTFRSYYEVIFFVVSLTVGYSFLDDGRLLQITAGIKLSSKRSSSDVKQNDQDIISTPLYVT